VSDRQIRKERDKTPAHNERFHASGGVCPQTVLWEFGSVSHPPEPLWNPRLREAATTLSASGGQRSGTPKRKSRKKMVILQNEKNSNHIKCTCVDFGRLQ